MLYHVCLLAATLTGLLRVVSSRECVNNDNEASPLQEEPQAIDNCVTRSSSIVLLVGASACLCLLIAALLVAALLHYQPSAISTLVGLLSTGRRRRGLVFGPPVHRAWACYATERSWAERVLHALRDRRDAAAETDSACDATTRAQFIYISVSPDFDSSATNKPHHHIGSFAGLD